MGEDDKPLLKCYTGSLLTIKQVAGILCVSEKFVRDRVKDGLIAAIFLPQKKGAKKTYARVKGEAVDAIIQSGGLPESE